MSQPPGFRPKAQNFKIAFKQPQLPNSYSGSFTHAEHTKSSPMQKTQQEYITNIAIQRIGQINQLKPIINPVSTIQSVPIDLIPYAYSLDIVDFKKIFSSKLDKELQRVNRLLKSSKGVNIIQTLLTSCDTKLNIGTVQHLIKQSSFYNILNQLKEYILRYSLVLQLFDAIIDSQLIVFLPQFIDSLSLADKVLLCQKQNLPDIFWKEMSNTLPKMDQQQIDELCIQATDFVGNGTEFNNFVAELVGRSGQ